MRTTEALALRGVLVSFLVFGLTGCQTLERFFLPNKAALREVHEVYRGEFLSSFGAPGTGTGAGIRLPSSSARTITTCEPAEGAGDPFPKTREKIREYRKEHPEGRGTDRELAHLTVLQGMIFLQAGRLGTARSLRGDVEAAATQLHSGAGRFVRDALFAENFSEMVDGWEAVCRALPRGDTETADRYADPAEAIENSLERHRTDGDLADTEADQGALYLSATAAIFYEWADLSNKNHCALNEPACDQPRLDDATYLKRGKQVLKDANVGAAAPARYEDVYRRIDAKIAERSR